MPKYSHIKKFTGSFLLIMTLWVAVPKVYIHSLFHHPHEQVKSDGQTRIEPEQSSEDCDFDQYNKPVYFNIFTFISKIIPVKPSNHGADRETGVQLPNVSVLLRFLRAPPFTQ